MNDGLGHIIHFLSCSVTGALGESAAHVVPAVPCKHELSDCCVVLAEGRQFLESELEMGGALHRSHHGTDTGAFHLLT